MQINLTTEDTRVGAHGAPDKEHFYPEKKTLLPKASSRAYHFSTTWLTYTMYEMKGDFTVHWLLLFIG